MSCYGHTVPPVALKYQGDGQSVKQILAQCPDPPAGCPDPTAQCPDPTAGCPDPTAQYPDPILWCPDPTAWCPYPTAPQGISSILSLSDL
jgi:hypothetical protein